ncbi:MAG: LysR family transcriptional regulator [Arenicella sp.]
MDTIEGMKTFIAVAHQHSFTGAAKALGISTKLASKYVAQLENKLGVQLLHRTTRSVSLTETGMAYYKRCIPIIDQLDELEGIIQERQSKLAGPIRITASTGFGSNELVEALKPFQRDNSGVTIDLHLSDHLVSIVEDGFDLAIRFGKLNDSSLVARKLKDMRIVVFASPKYLERMGEPTQPEALVNHDCLVSKVSVDRLHWKFMIDGKMVSIDVNGSFKANSPRAIAHMAAAGIGIGRGPMYAIEPFLKEGSLKILFEENEVTGFSLYAVYPPSRHLTARIRALIDHLANYFSAH